MHTSEEEGGLPRKGDDPLGVPRNSTSWYRGDVLPHTNKHTHKPSLSPYITLSLLLRSCIWLSFFAPSFSLDLSPCSFVYLSFYLFRGWVVVWTRGQTEKKEEKKEEELAKIQTACWNVEHSRCPFGDSLSSARTHVSWAWRNERKTQRFALQYLSMEIERISARTVQTVKINSYASISIVFNVCALCLQNWLLNVIVHILYDEISAKILN